jgi:hypothetical protein
MLKENDYKSILEKQEERILQLIKTLPEQHQKFMVQSWIDIKNRKVTSEQFSENLKKYINGSQNANNK